METSDLEISRLVGRLSEITQGLQASKRYSLYPIEDEETFRFYNRHCGTVWTNAEMDFSRDKEDYERLSPSQQRMLGTILAFFSAADGVILNNLAFRFILEARTLEEKAFFIVQQFIELIHSESYSVAINSIISDPEKRKELFEAADSHPSVMRRNRFMEKYLFSDIEKPYRLVAFACVEGISFISAFLFVFWFRARGLLANFVFQNEQISKDEALHRDFACHLYRLNKRLYQVDTLKVHEIIREVISIEEEFIRDLLCEEQDDLTVEQSINFVRRLANLLLLSMEEEPIFEEGEIPSWMNDLSIQQKSNLYEVRGGNYRSRNIDEVEKPFDYSGVVEDF